MDNEDIEAFSKYRLEKAKETLKSAKLLYDNEDLTGANNRAYYAIFYAIRSILALDEIDFKRHKDVISYFNKMYISKEIFPKNIGRKIAQAQRIREDCDYDDEYEPSHEKTLKQIETAKEVIELVDKYLKNKI
jgi:uncharacterized protein (UPF0332 family)